MFAKKKEDYLGRTVYIYNTFPIGKYRGENVNSIIEKDFQYVLWFIENIDTTLTANTFNRIVSKLRSLKTVKLKNNNRFKIDKNSHKRRFKEIVKTNSKKNYYLSSNHPWNK